MHPALAGEIVRQHIEDLHREAARQRLGRSGERHQNHEIRRRRVDAKRFQRAPAH